MTQIMARIMNEDIIEEILNYLEFRQLFQMERTSKQMSFCINRLLRRKKCLNFGEMNESILCEDFQHKCDEPLNHKKSSIVLNSLNIIPIVSKCPNIRSLYLNQILELETIESMAEICLSLECLCFGNTFLNSQSNQLQTIGLLFAKRVIHLSIECFFHEESIDGKVIEIIRHFTSLKNLRVIHFKPLRNTLNFAAIHLTSLQISCSPFWFSDSLGDGDINSLIAYIRHNDRCLKNLFISDYHISGQLLSLICNYLDLQKLSISCKLLSLNKVIEILCKTQNKLSFLSLNGLSVEDILVDTNRHYLNIRTLRLNSCHFEVKSFINFLKTFRFLETLDFNGLYFRCECNPNLNEWAFFCSKCNQKCLEVLSKSKTLRILKMNVMLTDVCPVWYALTRISKLERLRLRNVSRVDCKYLAQNLIQVLTAKTSKYFTIEFSSIEEKSSFVNELDFLCTERPRNLRIICNFY